jgi:hypothetical protein
MKVEEFKKKFPMLEVLEDDDIPLYPDGTIVEDGYVEIKDIYKHCVPKQTTKYIKQTQQTKEVLQYIFCLSTKVIEPKPFEFYCSNCDMFMCEEEIIRSEKNEKI